MRFGNFSIFFTRRISLFLIAIALFLLISTLLSSFKKRPKGGDFDQALLSSISQRPLSVRNKKIEMVN